MRISVVVPVYNEEQTVAQVLTLLSRVPLTLEVIVVDDASTDRTWEILQELRQQEPFNSYHYVRHEHNQGKGVGLRTGFGMVTGDLVTVQDADMEYNPQDLPALLAKWEEMHAAGKERGRGLRLSRSLGAKIHNALGQSLPHCRYQHPLWQPHPRHGDLL